jgi:hypothetical protein
MRGKDEDGHQDEIIYKTRVAALRMAFMQTHSSMPELTCIIE